MSDQLFRFHLQRVIATVTKTKLCKSHLPQINVNRRVCTVSSTRRIQTLIAAQKHRVLVTSIGELKLYTARACTKHLDETKWSETRDETPKLFGRDRDETRDAQFWDETETLSNFMLVRLDTVSRARPHPWYLNNGICGSQVLCITSNTVPICTTLWF